MAEVDDLETHGTAWGAALSSFCFFASGAVVPVLPYLLGLDGLAAVVVATALVGLALLVTGAVVGLLSGTSPLTLGRCARSPSASGPLASPMCWAWSSGPRWGDLGVHPLAPSSVFQ